MATFTGFVNLSIAVYMHLCWSQSQYIVSFILVLSVTLEYGSVPKTTIPLSPTKSHIYVEGFVVMWHIQLKELCLECGH